MKKRLLAILLAVVLVVSCLSISAAAALSSDWTTWSQGATSLTSEWYQKSTGKSAIANGACRLYSQAKLLAESGVIDPAKFDADDYVVWMEEHGYITGRKNGQYYVGETSATGSGMIAFAKERGVTITRIKINESLKGLTEDEQKSKIMDYINQGYYVIVDGDNPSGHQDYVLQATSKSKGTAWVSQSGGGWSTAKIKEYISYYTVSSNGKLINYPFTGIYVYAVSGTPTPTKPEAPSASVVNVNYIAETITYDGKYEVSSDSNFSTIISSGSKVNPGSLLFVRVKESGGVPASDATQFFLSTRPMLIGEISFDYATETFNSTNEFQYSFDNSTWQNCTGKLSYADVSGHDKVYFRLAATSSSFASDSYDVVVPTRSAAPSADVVTIDFINETISFENVYEANTAADFSGSAIESGGSVQLGASVYVRTKATADALASASAQVSIPARTEAPTVEAVDETIDGKGDGQITGVTAAMEYRAAGGSWADCPEGYVTGLADGSYEVRSKGTAESFASEAASVTIGKGVPATYTLELTIPELADEVYNYAQPEGSALNITSSGNSKSEIISVTVDDTDVFEIVGSGQYVEAGGSLTSYIVRPKTGLEAGDYAATVTVNYKGGETYSGEETFAVTADIAFTVEKAPQATPAAPSLESRTMTSITLKALPAKENGAQPQYRMNGGDWQTSPKFEGLRSGTTYVFEQRYAAVGSYLASEPSAKAQLSTVSPMLSEPHDIVVVPGLNGTVSSSLQNSSAGGTIWLTVTPAAGYRLAALRVTAENGANVAVYRQAENEYYFTMPDASVEVYAEFTDGSTWIPFLDISTRDWYYDAVVYVYSNGMMQGVTDTAFGPGSTMTRAMLWTVLARIDGRYVDGGSPWYANAQSWATSCGVSDGTLPNETVTREQFVTMLWRYAGSPAAYGSLAGFPDAASVSSWAYDAMCWAVANGIVEGGDGGALSPNAGITRAQAAAIFMRYAEL